MANAMGAATGAALDDTMPPEFDALVDHLIWGHIRMYGGYPYAFDWDGKRLIVAALDPSKDHNRTMLEIYRRGMVRAWITAARRYADEEGVDLADYDPPYDMDAICEAFGETQPEGVQGVVSDG